MKLKETLYYIGGVTLLAGAVLKMAMPLYASYIYTVGAVLFAIMQFLLRYRGGSVVVRRLVSMQQIGGLCLVAAGVLMFTHIRNEWIVAMFIGTLFELYTVFRLSHELEK